MSHQTDLDNHANQLNPNNKNYDGPNLDIVEVIREALLAVLKKLLSGNKK